MLIVLLNVVCIVGWANNPPPTHLLQDLCFHLSWAQKARLSMKYKKRRNASRDRNLRFIFHTDWSLCSLLKCLCLGLFWFSLAVQWFAPNLLWACAKASIKRKAYYVFGAHSVTGNFCWASWVLLFVVFHMAVTTNKGAQWSYIYIPHLHEN